MAIGTLSWKNETALTPYPLTSTFGYDSFLLDANFIQFDNFVPVLQSLEAINGTMNISILFDSGVQTIQVDDTTFSTQPALTLIYDSNNRYLGKLIFGHEASILLNSVLQNLVLRNVNIPFLAHTVKSIPSKCGVFSINNIFGSLEMYKDTNIFWSVSGNNVTLNAVTAPPYSNTPYLKTLNSTAPTDNNVYIRDNEVIKVTTPTTATIEIALAGTTIADLTQPTNIIISTNE